VVYVAYAVLRGVFSWHGFLYSVGLAPGAGLSFAPAVRVVTLLGLLELAVAVAMALDYLEGRRFLELRWAWAMAHGTLAIRLCRGTVWVVLSAATLACDLWHRRPAHVLPVRLDAAALCRVAVDRLADLRFGMALVVTRAGRLRWRRYCAVVPTETIVDAPSRVIEGTATSGSVLRSWRVLPTEQVVAVLDSTRAN